MTIRGSFGISDIEIEIEKKPNEIEKKIKINKKVVEEKRKEGKMNR